MQKATLITLITLLISSSALADFKISKGVYRMDQLDVAQAAAESNSMPITFLYSNEETTCPLCSAASDDVMDTLKRASIVVYADVKNDWQKLPNIVQNALLKPEAGKTIPITVLVDSKMSQILAIVPYARGKQHGKLLKQCRQDLLKAMPKPALPRQPVLTQRGPVALKILPDENREMRTWRSQSGAEVTASLVKESGSYLVLKKENGEKLQIALSKLSEQDQQYVLTQAGAKRPD